jgi:hypothetical protein
MASTYYEGSREVTVGRIFGVRGVEIPDFGGGPKTPKNPPAGAIFRDFS